MVTATSPTQVPNPALFGRDRRRRRKGRFGRHDEHTCQDEGPAAMERCHTIANRRIVVLPNLELGEPRYIDVSRLEYWPASRPPASPKFGKMTRLFGFVSVSGNSSGIGWIDRLVGDWREAGAGDAHVAKLMRRSCRANRARGSPALGAAFNHSASDLWRRSRKVGKPGPRVRSESGDHREREQDNHDGADDSSSTPRRREPKESKARWSGS
jgi:hypothetical protein